MRLYLATQQCIQPYAQQRRVSSAPTAAAAAAGPARTAGARKSSLGSLVSPWSASSGGGGGSSRKYPTGYYPRPRPSAQGYSPVDLFFAAPVGIPARRGGGPPAQLSRDDSSSSLDHFVTAPVGDFTTGAVAASAVLLPPPQHGNGSRPGSSDTDDWTFATASGGSGAGSFSGLDTTVDLTPSPPPSLRAGKIASRTSIIAAAPQPRQQPQSADIDTGPGPGPARWQPPNRVSAITLQVQDLQGAKRFYERVFGAPCISSSEDDTSATLRLNGGALVVTLRESLPDARRRSDVPGVGILLTVPVDDVAEVCRRLRSFAEQEGLMDGQRFAEPVTRPGGAQVLTFSDPAGHCWQVGHDLEGP
ncbi:hypothetical protein SLS63_002530 [Diaporthe eres]|uniref:VOC domain-containing protein n=1 Tax=Diaporthe eres TaxID=83184 RepID=A0ABR1PJI9_DIAER